jgi:hypothetical protein
MRLQQIESYAGGRDVAGTALSQPGDVCASQRGASRIGLAGERAGLLVDTEYWPPWVVTTRRRVDPVGSAGSIATAHVFEPTPLEPTTHWTKDEPQEYTYHFC